MFIPDSTPEEEKEILEEFKLCEYSNNDIIKLLSDVIDEEYLEKNLAGPKKLGVLTIGCEIGNAYLSSGLIELSKYDTVKNKTHVTIPAMNMVKYFSH